MTDRNKDSLYVGGSHPSYSDALKQKEKGMDVFIRQSQTPEYTPCLTGPGIFCSKMQATTIYYKFRSININYVANAIPLTYNNVELSQYTCGFVSCFLKEVGCVNPY